MQSHVMDPPSIVEQFRYNQSFCNNPSSFKRREPFRINLSTDSSIKKITRNCTPDY